jgi:hypothetical protein
MSGTTPSTIPERLPAHMRVTYTLFMTSDATGLEMAVAIKELPVHLAFADDALPAAVAKALGFREGHFEDWRFMTAAETADYLKRRDDGDLDDLVEEV